MASQSNLSAMNPAARRRLSQGRLPSPQRRGTVLSTVSSTTMVRVPSVHHPGPAFAETLAATERAQRREIFDAYRDEVVSIVMDAYAYEAAIANANAGQNGGGRSNAGRPIVNFAFRTALNEYFRLSRSVAQTGWMLACGTNALLALRVVEAVPPRRGADVDAAPEAPVLHLPVPIRYTNRNLRDCNIRAVSVGGMFAYAVSTNGTVYSWGSSDGGCLGRVEPPGLRNDDEPNNGKSTRHVWEETPQPVQGLRTAVLQVAAGNNHAAFLTADGSVHVCGMYLDSEGGKFRDAPPQSHGNRDPVVVFPEGPHDPPANINETSVRIDLPCRAVQISSGRSSNYTYALLEDDYLYSWGIGNFGELARTESMQLPLGVNGELTAVPTTYHYPDGSVNYTHLMKFLQPGRVPLPFGKNTRVLSVACGGAHVAIAVRQRNDLHGKGRIYTCGLNNYGQLGNGLARTRNNAAALAAGGIVERHCFGPVTALDDEDMVHVAAGDEHSLALTHCRTRVFAWGRCDKGQLGLGPEYGQPGGVDNVAIPTQVTFPNQPQPLILKDVACGGSHSMALTYTGDVYTWGFTDGINVQATGHRAPPDRDIYVPTKLEMQVGSQGPRFLCTSFAGGTHGSLFLVKQRPENIPNEDNNGPE